MPPSRRCYQRVIVSKPAAAGRLPTGPRQPDTGRSGEDGGRPLPGRAAGRAGLITPPTPARPPARTSRLCSGRARSPRAAGRRTRAGATPALRSVREGAAEHFRPVLRGAASGPPRWTPGRGREPPTISASGAGAFSRRKGRKRRKCAVLRRRRRALWLRARTTPLQSLLSPKDWPPGHAPSNQRANGEGL